LNLFSAIQAVVTSVVNDVISDVNIFSGAGQAGTPGAVMGEQIVMIRGMGTTPNASESMMVSVTMVGFIQAFRHHAPLNRYVFAMVDRKNFITAPTG